MNKKIFMLLLGLFIISSLVLVSCSTNTVSDDSNSVVVSDDYVSNSTEPVTNGGIEPFLDEQLLDNDSDVEVGDMV